MIRLFSIILILLGTLTTFSQEDSGFSYSRMQVSLKAKKNDASFKLINGVHNNVARAKIAPAIQGTWKQTENQSIFTPLVPLQWNTSYTLLHNNNLHTFTIPIPEDYKPLQVTAIHPNTTTLPANFLKWYIQFSKPINPSRIYDHITITDGDGNPIDRALLPLLNPLLSKDRTLLTLWIEPGRQKRDLGPNARLGSVFKTGERYALSISGLKDHNGISMPSHFTQQFTIATADRKKPAIETWMIKTPTPGTIEPLRIICNETLDYGSIQDALHITTKTGIEIAGKTQWNPKKKTIYFIPISNWNNDYYTILFDKTLEDLAGNNIVRLFDADVRDSSKELYTQKTRSFQIN